MSYKTKQNLMRIGVIILLITVIALVFSLFGNKSNKETDDYEKVRVTWDVGGLDAAGIFEESYDTNLTSGFIEINKGLRFIMKENKNFFYTMHVYDENKVFLGIYSECDENDINATFSLGEIQNDYERAKYVRIDISNIDSDDNHFDWFEKQKYSKYLTIYTTEKEQSTSNNE